MSMNKKRKINFYYSFALSVLIILTLLIFNIIQYKNSLNIKIEHGEKLSIMITDTLYLAKQDIENIEDNNLTKGEIEKKIIALKTAKHLTDIGTSKEFNKLIDLLNDLIENYEKLYITFDRSNTYERKLLIEALVNDRVKISKIYKDIQITIDKLNKSDEETYLMWFNNDIGKSKEIIEIINQNIL